MDTDFFKVREAFCSHCRKWIDTDTWLDVESLDDDYVAMPPEASQLGVLPRIMTVPDDRKRYLIRHWAGGRVTHEFISTLRIADVELFR